MEIAFKKHCTDDALELYALGRLEESGTEELEEHILLCEPCRERLDEADAFVRAMKGAAARLRSEKEEESFAARFARSFRISSFPVWVAGAACACVLALSAALVLRPAATGLPVAVSLRAERGAANIVPAHRSLVVTLDARGLEPAGPAHLVLVNTAGATLEQADDPVRNGRIEARFAKSLSQGEYFVRIYLAGVKTPVREFALHAE